MTESLIPISEPLPNRRRGGKGWRLEVGISNGYTALRHAGSTFFRGRILGNRRRAVPIHSSATVPISNSRRGIMYDDSFRTRRVQVRFQSISQSPRPTEPRPSLSQKGAFPEIFMGFPRRNKQVHDRGGLSAFIFLLFSIPYLREKNTVKQSATRTAKQVQQAQKGKETPAPMAMV